MDWTGPSWAMKLLGAADRWPRLGRQAAMAAGDWSLGVACLWLALVLRLETHELPAGISWWHLALLGAAVPPAFLAFGLYREITRYIGPRYAVLLAKGCLAFGILSEAAVLGAQSLGTMVPRTAPVIAAILLFGSAGALRLAIRRLLRLRAQVTNRVVILGASDAGAGLVAALAHDRTTQLVAVLDDSPALAGGALRSVRIFPTDRFDEILDRTGFDSLLVALSPQSRSRRRALLEHAAARGVRVLAVPTLAEIHEGRVSVHALRPLDIEELLGREPAEPDPDLVAADVAGRTVMITGAGGSIGGELCRQALRLGPKALVLVDNCEFNLFQIDSELTEGQRSLAPGSLRPAVHRCLASVTDAVRMDRLFAEHRPETVLHAAAYKHVPLVEENGAEGADVNVLGTLRIAEAAMRHGARSFVFVSTDKAVRPSSVMGATKRAGEELLQALQAQFGLSSGTRFTMVRFGNVLGSSGSVVPIFRRQIERGGPVTVTHPDVARYFMSIPEAAQLILQAGAMGRGGDIFVLDMGEPVRIADLARNMVTLAGRSVRSPSNPAGDVEIVFTGLRPGEKLFEELVIDAELEATRHPSIRRAREQFRPWSEIEPVLQRLEAAVSQHDEAAVRQVLGLGAAAKAGEPR